jgi:hypothetical protein
MFQTVGAAMVQRLYCRFFSSWRTLIDFFESQIIVVCIVHLHRRRVATGSKALDFCQRELAVVGRLTFLDAESFRHVVKDFLTAKQQDTRCCANLNVMLSDWLPSQHAVERDDFVHFDLGQLQVTRNRGYGLRRTDVPRCSCVVSRIGISAERFDRIVADDRVEFCKKLIGNHEMGAGSQGGEAVHCMLKGQTVGFEGCRIQ